PCGSPSMSSVRCSAAASEAARLTAVVVFPTPPFWLAIAMTRVTGLVQDGRYVRGRRRNLSRRATRCSLVATARRPLWNVKKERPAGCTVPPVAESSVEREKSSGYCPLTNFQVAKMVTVRLCSPGLIGVAASATRADIITGRGGEGGGIGLPPLMFRDTRPPRWPPAAL